MTEGERYRKLLEQRGQQTPEMRKVEALEMIADTLQAILRQLAKPAGR